MSYKSCAHSAAQGATRRHAWPGPKDPRHGVASRIVLHTCVRVVTRCYPHEMCGLPVDLEKLPNDSPRSAKFIVPLTLGGRWAIH